MTVDFTASDSDPSPTPVDELVSQWLDRDGTNGSDPIPSDRLSREERCRAVDLLWVDGLIHQALRPVDDQREVRIQRIVKAVRETLTRPASSLGRRARWWVPAVVAASLVAFAFLLNQNAGLQQTAEAAVTSALKEMQSAQDRRYEIQTTIARRNGVERNLVANLWVRGTRQFVLQQKGWLGSLMYGCNGQEYWFMLPIGPVFISTDGGSVRDALLGKPIASPFLHLSTILERFSERYDLKLVDEEELPNVDAPGTTRCVKVSGRQREPYDTVWPDEITLWTTRGTGVAYRIELRWLDDAQPGFRSMVVQVQPPGGEPVAANWYDYRTHAGQRQVMQSPPELPDADEP